VDDGEIEVRSPDLRQRQGTVLPFEKHRSAIGPSQSPLHVQQIVSLGVKLQAMKLTTHLHLVPTLKVMEPHLHSPVSLNGVVLNSLSSGMLPLTHP
jgi:hypothetical protein